MDMEIVSIWFNGLLSVTTYRKKVADHWKYYLGIGYGKQEAILAF